MDAYSQEERLLQIETVLGAGSVLLTGLRGTDRLSSIFAFDLELSSSNFGITADQMLRTSATVSVQAHAGSGLTYNGMICHFDVTGRHSARGLCRYRARLVPALWLLTRTRDCRIFQNMTVRDIVDSVIVDHGITARAWKLSRQYEKREFCVQYRESAYAFVCRLLEEEGIFFYFRHDSTSHTIVLSDSNHGLYACATPSVQIMPPDGHIGGICEWRSSFRYGAGLWSLSDFNFETPSAALAAQEKTVNAVLAKAPLERFDYPGRYVSVGSGESLAKLRIEYEESAYQDVHGEGACAGFAAGASFSLSNGDASTAGVTYFLVDVTHCAEDLSQVEGNAGAASYSNQFSCRPQTIPYRPAMATPRPHIHGAQTAIVTGPGGAEICTDNYGRIKVHFHWDRHGPTNDQSSCWVRVAQATAGAGWGSWFVPRIGQEVVVVFLEGNPDRPLVVGSVYNAAQPVPFSLPGNATQSGYRSRSSMGGSAANCNELRFEDKKGAEQVYLHAERNMDASVELDETHTVGHDQAITVQHNRNKTVVNDETTAIGGNRTEAVAKNEAVTITLTRQHTIGPLDQLTVAGARVHTIGLTEAITIGASRAIGVGTSQSVQIGSTLSTSVGSDKSTTIGGGDTLSVAKDRGASIDGNDSLNVRQNISVQSGKQISIQAGDEIVLSTGSASITMKKNGDITIEGKQITIKGSGDVIIKGQKILQN